MTTDPKPTLGTFSTLSIGIGGMVGGAPGQARSPRSGSVRPKKVFTSLTEWGSGARRGSGLSASAWHCRQLSKRSWLMIGATRPSTRMPSA